MDNASTEVSLVAQSEMLKEGADHLPVVIFAEDNIYADKPVPVVNLPPVRFIVCLTRQVIIGRIHGAWDLDRSESVVTALGIPVDEAL